MSKIIKQTKKLSAVGPYSLAIQKANTLYCSGQIGINEKSKLVDGGMLEEFKVIMTNIADVLREADFSMGDVVKVVLYVTDLYEYKKLNEVYSNYFEEPYPVRTTVEVSRLPLNASIEVEVTAVKD
jgi:2-iminobutanoate/2-iminopropanoate deaminase